MLQALLVTFREGLESFLIVAVVVGYLRKTGRAGLLRGVRLGLGASVLTCAAGAWLWMEVPNQPLAEGIAALLAAALVGGFLVQMMRTGKRFKGDIEARIDRATAAPAAEPAPAAAPGAATLVPWRAVLGVALVITLLVTREGLEAVFFLGIQTRAANAAAVVPGAALGMVLAGVLAWLWTTYSGRLDIGAVLRVTAIFLSLFLVQLVVYGIHELAESGVIEGSQAFHDATERFGPDGSIGHVLSYSLAAAPLLYLVLARRGARRRSQAQLPQQAAA